MNNSLFRRRGMQSITVGVLEIARGRDLVKLRALEKLCEGECFNDWALLLEVRQALEPLLASKHAKGEVTEEEVRPCESLARDRRCRFCCFQLCRLQFLTSQKNTILLTYRFSTASWRWGWLTTG